MCNGCFFFSYLRFLLQVLVLLLGIEAGAVLVDVGEVAVTEDDGLGVIDAQRLEQGMEGGFLRCSARVLGTAVGIETALVADADAVLVVVAGVGAGEVLKPKRLSWQAMSEVTGNGRFSRVAEQ